MSAASPSQPVTASWRGKFKPTQSLLNVLPSGFLQLPAESNCPPNESHSFFSYTRIAFPSLSLPGLPSLPQNLMLDELCSSTWSFNPHLLTKYLSIFLRSSSFNAFCMTMISATLPWKFWPWAPPMKKWLKSLVEPFFFSINKPSI